MKNVLLLEALALIAIALILISGFLAINKYFLLRTISYLNVTFIEGILGSILLLSLALWTPFARFIVSSILSRDFSSKELIFYINRLLDVDTFEAAKCFSAVFLVASAEELVFRGIFLGTFLRFGRIRSGIVISSLMFVIAHGSFNAMQVVYYFTHGMALALICMRFGIFAAIYFHTLINFPRALELRMYIGGVDLIDPFTNNISGFGFVIYTTILCVPLIFLILHLYARRENVVKQGFGKD